MRKNDEARMTNDEGMTKSGNMREDFDEVFWNRATTAVVREESEKERVYDLEERTARFGESVIDFAKSIPQDAVTNRIISQLVGAGTSVGSNYVEDDDAMYEKALLSCSQTCQVETRRVECFLRMVARAL